MPNIPATLVTRLPNSLAPLAELAYDLRWLWRPECRQLFADIDEPLFLQCGENPVDLLHEVTPQALERCAVDSSYMQRMLAIVSQRESELQRPSSAPGPASAEHPVAFFCAEYALHTALPIYAGGLGVLAGDFLKEASDRALPFVGVGLLYRNGYFHQRLDASGWQHEYWTPVRRTHLPVRPVLGPDGEQVRIRVPYADREIVACAWCAQIGRVPLWLLDTDVPDNPGADRFVSAQLYVGDRELRLMQYIVLGIGGIRLLRAVGVEPAIYHLNEGHAAFAILELLRERVAAGVPATEALEQIRRRLIFTTHTPVAAGNESYSEPELERALGGLATQLGMSWRQLFALGHSGDDASRAFGMTPFALRAACAANGVSRRHGEVARSMWRSMYSGPERAPIGHVTNGVHVPTWVAPPMAKLLGRHLGADWQQRADDPSTWDPIEHIPDSQLWGVRCELRRALVEHVRSRSIEDRLARGDMLQYVEAAARAFDPNVLTVGFARRVASYKRLHLLTQDMSRALALLSADRPIQVVIAGKAHPRDDEAKRIIQVVFGMKSSPIVGARVVFLEDYDLATARYLVSGCDVWINAPRPPLEASGTSGMKAMFNGAVNLSVLDGWWEEAWDGRNGWAIQSDSGLDPRVQDARDAEQLYGLLEHEVVPLFHLRGTDGLPHAWLAKVKASLRTLGPRFAAGRMLREYCTRQYARVQNELGSAHTARQDKP